MRHDRVAETCDILPLFDPLSADGRSTYAKEVANTTIHLGDETRAAVCDELSDVFDYHFSLH